MKDSNPSTLAPKPVLFTITVDWLLCCLKYSMLSTVVKSDGHSLGRYKSVSWLSDLSFLICKMLSVLRVSFESHIGW